MIIRFATECVETLSDGSIEIYLDIKPEFQIFVGYLLEGLDGYCYHTIVDYPSGKNNSDFGKTDDSKKKLMKITVTPDYYSDIKSFLTDLQGYEI